ncbi:poly-beta-hydroxybutyrate polymerase [Sphingobium lactosutens DS20]|uniref:Poly-beta-hydroxybutyrate polymerase n=1 Tax=Sphingobium lactosutens DS20 TaxID=1331060 RepID=T0J166_9SPHN|nr:poly-beta-hydroxybutyrate polymerase [Sphingobium lactosutens DS20]
MPLFLNILWRETEGDPNLRKRALAGLRKYQVAHRAPPHEAGRCIAKAGPARLLQYGAGKHGVPVVFIPSLINPPRVLDLSERRSLLRHMAAAGHDAYLVDWGAPGAADATLGLDRHVTERLLPLLAALPCPPILVGYCLGGSLALGAAALIPATAVATIAAPWRFSRFPAADLDLIAGLWRGAKPMCQRIGYVPMEVLQSGFWAMDPARTIRKFAAFADAEPGSDAEQAFLAVEDWANEGAPLTYAAGRDLFESFYAADTPGRGQWRIENRVVAPEDLACPTLSIRSTTDRIVPAAASPNLRDVRNLSLGHVGMVVGGRARDLLWVPLSHWLSSHSG